MDAVVLVGGEGTRLRPLTYDVPKQMLPIVERPMLERVLEWLGGHGVSRAVLSLGYRPDAFLAAFPEGRAHGVELAYAVEPELLDTAGAIRFAARAAGVEGTFVVVNGDVLTDLDLGALVRFHRERGATATIALTPVADPSAFGVVPTGPDGRVVAFVEKPAPGTAPTNEVNAGTYVLEAEVVDMIPAGRRVSVERETFPELAAAGRLFAWASDAYWIDTGTPRQYVAAQVDVLRGRREAVSLPESTERPARVFVAPGARVAADIGPNAFVGADAVVGEGARVVDAVVGARAGVCRGASIVRSVLLPGAVVEEGARVEECVVGPAARVGAGAVLGGWSVVGKGASVPAGCRLEGARLPAD